MKDKISKAIWVIIALIFLISPFALGWMIFRLLGPVDFWQNFAALVLSITLCLMEGLIAWILAFTILGAKL